MARAATVIEKLKIFEEKIDKRNGMLRCDRPSPARTASRRP